MDKGSEYWALWLLFAAGLFISVLLIDPINAIFHTSLGVIVFPGWLVIYGLIGLYRQKTIKFTTEFFDQELLNGKEATNMSMHLIIMGVAFCLLFIIGFWDYLF